MERDAQKSQVPTLILAVLAQGPCHGYAIARQIEAQSKSALQVGEGSLYPMLRNLERNGFVLPQWEIQDGPARKVYTLTDAGRSELERLTREWVRYREGFDTILGGFLHGQPA